MGSYTKLKSPTVHERERERERERDRDAHVCIEKKKTKMKSWRFVKNLVVQLTLPGVFNEDT